MKKRRLCGVLLLLLLVWGVAVCRWEPARAAEPVRVVRVAYPLQAGLTDIDENGKYTGYTYEYLEEIAQYTGWEYEFVQAPGDTDESLTALLEMVRRGEVDIMGSTLYDETLAASYHYSRQSYGIVETVLQTLQERPRSIARGDKIRVAMLHGTSKRLEELEDFCAMNQVEATYVFCDSAEEMELALQEGRADALLATSLSDAQGMYSIAHFAPRPFYFITGKTQDDGLLEELNQAMAAIEQTDPEFSTALQQKYFRQSASLTFSEEEQAFIRQNGVLRVGVRADEPPFQYLEDGAPKGIAIDLLRVLGEKTGLQFQLVPVSDDRALQEAVETGQVDMVAGMNYDYDAAQARGLVMSRPYVSASYILLIHEAVSMGSLGGKRLAMSQTSSYRGPFIGKETWYDNVEACVRAVNQGAEDYTYVDSYAAQYYINQPEFSRVRSIPQKHAPRQVCFGVVKPGGVALMSVLNKTILAISLEEMQAIIYNNTVYRQTFSWGNLLRAYPLETVLTVAGFFLAVIGLLSASVYQHDRMRKKIALDLRKHLQLYELANDSFFEYDFRNQTLIFSTPKKNGKGELAALERYDFKQSIHEGLDAMRAAQFMELVIRKGDGIREVCLTGADGVPHWMRAAVKTVYDHAQPIYAVGRLSNYEAEKQERDQLKKQAQLDGLTKIYNAETSRQRIERHLQGLHGTACGALFVVDVDYFKRVNDTLGHMQGDEVLRKIAALLLENFRDDDVVGRQGGDEFIVYMHMPREAGVVPGKCRALCERVREIALGEDWRLSISVGVAVARPGDGFTTLYQRADQALYKTKQAGRDGFTIFQQNTDG